jgi:UDP-N-acetylglucosamine transferase subunit ALG13
VKIFVTVGTQLPFDRLISAIDGWAAHNSAEVFAQTGTSPLRPKHIAWKDFIDNREANERIRTADLVVGHAGMGTILTRLETGLPMLVMPRQAALGEHRNDHQLATAKRLSHLPGLWVVEDEEDLCERLDTFEAPRFTSRVEAVASPALITAIREFVSI